jgi:predicted CoA-binding protein
MEKLSKKFFNGNEVLFVGYSSRNKIFSQDLYRTISNNGIKVYPYNKKKDGLYDIEVYNDLNQLPKIPEAAFVLLNSANAAKAAEELSEKGVKRILFQSKKNVSQETIDFLGKKGVEVYVGCPLMLFGKGIHKIHAFFAGVK